MKNTAALATLSVVLVAGCTSPSTPAATPATTTPASTAAAEFIPEPSATPSTESPSPEPVPVETSGDYGADLATAGVIPDDVLDYGQFMKEELCDASLGKHKFWDRSVLSENIRTLASAEPDDVAAVRISVAYFCPERAELAEEALREHGHIK